eukprot:CAMPEP_0175096324 /NCGR_PEP_ID=MMETSP0086_2-20121207/4669_1 /TAXON_ID=136419 /ORGANISM="Unknown Unknown, Strain D1" /LENGTH=194 /DNA_ID=CAMNT_0016369713 /DNA_START=115 /DNA_END=699 /DNA_ORIENTATION=+
MTRTIQTAHPLATALGVPIEVHPSIHETGGVFVGQTLSYAPGLSSAAMKQLSPAVCTDMVPANGPWNGRKGFETNKESFERAMAVAEWLQSADFQESMSYEDAGGSRPCKQIKPRESNPCGMFVCQLARSEPRCASWCLTQTFLDMLLVALLKLRPNPITSKRVCHFAHPGALLLIVAVCLPVIIEEVSWVLIT